MESIISIKGLKKSFENKQVLVDLNIEIKKNLITVMMGANGQGKTTLINSILSLTDVDSGKIYINNEKVENTLTLNQKKNICFISDNPPFIEYLNCLDNLKYISYIYKKKIDKNEIAKILTEYGLNFDNKTLVRDYSKGMRTKLALSFIDIIDSKIVILDEPTVGLDIVSAEYLKNKLLKLKDKGKSIFVTSHDTAFVSGIADEIYLLNNKSCTLLLDDKKIIRNTNLMSEKLLSNINVELAI